MIVKNTSTLSKVNKSPEWKARKKALHEENRALRASLESQKAAKPSDRMDLQRRIDAISNKGKAK